MKSRAKIIIPFGVMNFKDGSVDLKGFFMFWSFPGIKLKLSFKKSEQG